MNQPKFTKAQIAALAKLNVESGSSYSHRIGLSTLHTLQTRGLVKAVGFGHIALPTSARWEITKEGRAVVRDMQRP